MWVKLDVGAYLNIPKKVVRKMVLDHNMHMCSDCESTSNLILHHKVYRRWLPWPDTAYSLDEFGILCVSCNSAPRNRKRDLVNMGVGNESCMG